MEKFEEIGKNILDNEITKEIKKYSINKLDIETYYNIGHTIEAVYNDLNISIDDIIIFLSKELEEQFGFNNKFSEDSLWNAYDFYIAFKDEEISKLALLSWKHYKFLLKVGDVEGMRLLYNLAVDNNMSVSNLKNIIKGKNYKIYNNINNIYSEKLRDLII